MDFLMLNMRVLSTLMPSTTVEPLYTTVKVDWKLCDWTFFLTPNSKTGGRQRPGGAAIQYASLTPTSSPYVKGNK